MKKTWNFKVKGHSVEVVNRWFGGMTLFIDGERRDHNSSLLAFGGKVMLSADLGEPGLLEIEPKAIFTVEIDVYLTQQEKRIPVFKSDGRLSLRERREAAE